MGLDWGNVSPVVIRQMINLHLTRLLYLILLRMMRKTLVNLRLLSRLCIDRPSTDHCTRKLGTTLIDHHPLLDPLPYHTGLPNTRVFGSEPSEVVLSPNPKKL
jgi:hypothetical protein